MSSPVFRDWLIAVAPRFPLFARLAAMVDADANWPPGHDKPTLRRHLRDRGHGELTADLAAALDAFSVLCAPTMPNASLPWDWHTALLVEQTNASLERHRRNRRVSTHEYRFQLGQRLAVEMAAKTRIYVDTCHWVKMRDFERGRDVPPAYGEILAHLRRLVATGHYICPLSAPLFTELQTQSDLVTRAHTARLMEELSQNVGLPHLSEIEKLELRRMALERCFGLGALNTDWQLWRKGTLMIVERWPVQPGLNQEETWYLQKFALDAMWEAPFTQLVSVMPELLDTREMRNRFAANLNADREARPPTDFETERQRALATIVHGFLIPHMPELFEEVRLLASRRPGFQLPTEFGGLDPRCLPSVQVLSGVDAFIRTSGRRYRPNDMFDLFHCTAAIPYFQVFLCDTAFKHIVTDPKLRYDEKYGVKVFAAPEEIRAYLLTQ